MIATIIVTIIMIYAINISICCFLSIHFSIPFPETKWQFIKSTFLPYVLYNLLKSK